MLAVFDNHILLDGYKNSIMWEGDLSLLPLALLKQIKERIAILTFVYKVNLVTDDFWIAGWQIAI